MTTDATLAPLATDEPGESLLKINALLFDSLSANDAGLVIAKLAAPATIAAGPSAQALAIESYSISGNTLFDSLPPYGLIVTARSMIQASAWIQVGTPPNSAFLSIQLDSTDTPGGLLLTLVSAGLVASVANASLGALVNAGDILRVLLRTDTTTQLNYGTLTILATPIG